MAEDLWDHVLRLMRTCSPRYSMAEDAQKIVFEYASHIGAPGLIVELGVCHGKTALMLAWVAWQNGLKYIGVDHWGLEGSYTEVRDAFDKAGLPGGEQILFYACDTHTVQLPTEPISLLLIDAGHDEANVSVDCERWIPLVKPGGYVIFDDYPGVSDPDNCHNAVRKHADIWTGSWEMLHYHSGRMMIRRKPLDAPQSS